jgi:hypothetical protein
LCIGGGTVWCTKCTTLAQDDEEHAQCVISCFPRGAGESVRGRRCTRHTIVYCPLPRAFWAPRASACNQWGTRGSAAPATEGAGVRRSPRTASPAMLSSLCLGARAAGASGCEVRAEARTEEGKEPAAVGPPAGALLRPKRSAGRDKGVTCDPSDSGDDPTAVGRGASRLPGGRRPAGARRPRSESCESRELQGAVFLHFQGRVAF